MPQRSGSVSGPQVAAIAEVAGGFALDERRVGEHRRHYRLQRQADAELAHHIGLGEEVEIHLHRAGAQHHVQTVGALARHVVAHDGVAVLRHPRHVVASPFWVEAHSHHGDAQLLADAADLLQMFADFGAGLMDGLHRRARQLDLAARFQGDRFAAFAAECDHVFALIDRLPAEPGEAGEHVANARRIGVGQGPQTG